MNCFEAKVAVITGAGAGIGRALAVELARRGARLSLLDRDASALEEVAASCETLGTRVLTKVVDVTDWEAVQVAAVVANSELGGVDSVFAAAGIIHRGSPAAGRITVAEWADDWLDALDLSRNTETQYRSLATNHILPRWGETSLADITGLAVAAWRKQLSARCAPSTITTIVKVLSMMLADAADDKLIAANPIRPRRRGKRHRTKTRERVWATHQQALRVADNAAALVGPWAGTLMITAAWTGARWGELTGLQRHNTHLDDACIVIDPDTGALHEINGHFELGPPKTAESARTITLPRFLIPLLRRHLDSHDHPHVFVTAEGEYLRRSNFSRRAMRPAADGNLKRTAPPVRIDPVQPGLTFHGFRHSHKTWMIADGVPEIAQAARLGHTLEDKMQKVYSHIAAEVEHRLITGLQDRWDKAVADSPTPEPHTRWRRL